MKTTTTTFIIAALMLALQTTFTFAGNETATPVNSFEISALNVAALAPATPAEATFEEINATVIEPAALAPITPVAADFSDMVPVIDIAAIAPVTPVEADFE